MIILIIMMIVTMITIIAIMVVMMMMMMHPLFVSLGVCACVLLRASAHVSSSVMWQGSNSPETRDL